jgi:arabinose operon protein AraL
METNIPFDRIEGYVFDLDGTVYLGEQALPGAAALMAALRRQDKKCVFITNKPLAPRDEYARKLTHLGIPTYPQDVITSGYVLGRTLAATQPDLALYVVGEENLKKELLSHNLNILAELIDQDEKEVIDASAIDAVIVAFDRTLDYRKINTAYQAIINGSRFYATNSDKTCPMPGGGIPDAGGTIALLEHLSNRKVELIAGKPSEVMMQTAIQYLELSPEKCLLVGDRLETDIRMGKQAGMYAAVVLSGASSREQAMQAVPAPDHIFEHIGEIRQYIQ